MFLPRARSIRSRIGQAAGTEAADSLTYGAPVQCPAAPDTVESKDADQCGQHVSDVVQTCYPLAISGSDTGNSEDFGTIDCYARNACRPGIDQSANAFDGDEKGPQVNPLTDPLLQNLQPDDQLHPTCGVQLALFHAEQHCKIALLLRVLALKFDDVLDVTELGFSPAFLFAAKTLQDEEGLVLATDFGEPSTCGSQRVVAVRVDVDTYRALSGMNQMIMSRPKRGTIC